ncbi:MAG: putative sugar transporter, periplasmic sugar-binding protein [Actinoallomurus sp.]|nr:putative sugar transporter, periplasmic sugar-binding protein [Actinoallomurus sp.]
MLQLPQAADDQHAQMVTNLQAKSDRYDVLNLDVVWTAEFADAGWIIPLDRRQFPLDQFIKPVVDTAVFDGKLYAVPFTSNAGLLYYRKDVLAKAGKRPPKTWAELRNLAKTVAPKYGLEGYAGQFLPYEGLTVNFAEAVQSAGGAILTDDGTQVAVDSPQARKGMEFLVQGFREGWIPKQALTYKEEESRREFQQGKLLFLRNWPYAYGLAARSDSKIRNKFGVTLLPGENGPGSSSLGGGNLAVSAYSKHQKTAIAFITYFTSLENERQVLIEGSFPPVWARLYDDPALIKRFPYLPVLKQSILSAKPRPVSPNYNQVSLAISNAVSGALSFRQPPDAAVSQLAGDLRSVITNR